MIQQMTPRERVLSAIVGLTALVLVNLFLVKFFVKNHRQLRTDLVDKKAQLETMRTLLTERDLWMDRDRFIRNAQPKLVDRDGAAVTLLGAVKDIASKHSIVLENAQPGSPDPKPQYISVWVSFETKSKWQDLVAFLSELQAPEQFLVFENANLQIDGADKTQMRGTFRLAKWFAK
jgi:Type II secretion system (T2SS), protein M subtype b